VVSTWNAISDYIQAQHDLLLGALEVLTTERHLADDMASVHALSEAEGRMALAARRLVQAIEALPAARQPKGWTA
jgi:hypothetical protein